MEKGSYKPLGAAGSTCDEFDALTCASRPFVAPCSDNHELRAALYGDSLDRFTAW